jgi:hypothetical protein
LGVLGGILQIPPTVATVFCAAAIVLVLENRGIENEDSEGIRPLVRRMSRCDVCAAS